MKSYLNLLRAATLLIAWLIASDANADWLDAFTYNAGVSNSPSGPFASSVTLWSQSVTSGVPSSVNLIADNFPPIFVDGKVRLQIASIEWVVGIANFTIALPLPHQLPYFIQLTFPDQKTVLVGELDSPSFFWTSLNYLKFKGPDTLTLGSKKYKISVEPDYIGLPGPPGPPGPYSTSVVVGAYGLWATIPLDDIAPTPEPASFVLAGIGGIGFIGLAWRRHRKRNDSAS